MKTVRFSNLVRRCGEPENHLVLVDPKRDKTLQAAVKAKRILTVFQPTVGVKAEYGEVGFQPGKSRQFFIFSKSLKTYEGRRVVGIKYREPVRKKDKPTGRSDEEAAHKVVKFPAPIKPSHGSGDDEIDEIKSQVKRAMNALEQGKQVAAFNLLKTIVDK